MLCNWNFSNLHNQSNRLKRLFSLVLWFFMGGSGGLTAFPQGMSGNAAVVLSATMTAGCCDHSSWGQG